MKLGQLFSKLANKSEERKENFLALEISNETVKAAAWSVVKRKVKVLRLGSIEEWESKEDLLKAADAAVTSACEGITPEPEKVIFGLPQDWVKGESIVSSKKPLLANSCQSLALKPVGFVVSLEALTTYLKLKQGIPASAIFVRLGQSDIIVSLVSLGKIVGSEAVGRSEDLALDIKEGLARFKKVENLPARIILFDGLVDFEEAKQQIISFDWLKNLPFLHFPKVESFGRNFLMKAIAIAGGSEVAKSLGFQISEEEEKAASESLKKTKDTGEESMKLPAKASIEEADKKKKRKDEKQKQEVEEKAKDEKDKVEEREEELTAKDLGFVVGKDIRKLEKEEQPLVEEEEKSRPEKDFLFEPRVEEREGKNILSFLTLPMRFFLKRKRSLLILPFLLLIFGGIFAWWYWPKAKVVLYFSPQDIEQEVSLKLSTTAASGDEDEGVIPAEELKIEVEGEGEQGTSGEKLVGEKAHGQVIIYNKTELTKTFVQGAVLVGESNLNYILEEEMTVASRSTQTTSEGEEITWGKTAAEIIADSVGEESNTEAGSSFTFEDYPSSSFTAKSEEGLTGGSSEKVKTVTAGDRKKLLEKLTQELEEKAKKELEEKLSTEKIILDKALETEVSSEKFDKKVGEEGENLKLNLQLTLTTFAFFKEDLNKVLSNKLSKDIPSGFVLAENDFQTEISRVDSEEDLAEVEMIVKANLKPDLDIEELQKELAGKTTEKAEDYLLSLPNFVRAKIDVSPTFLGIFKTLPKLAKNIKIEVEVE